MCKKNLIRAAHVLYALSQTSLRYNAKLNSGIKGKETNFEIKMKLSTGILSVIVTAIVIPDPLQRINEQIATRGQENQRQVPPTQVQVPPPTQDQKTPVQEQRPPTQVQVPPVQDQRPPVQEQRPPTQGQIPQGQVPPTQGQIPPIQGQRPPTEQRPQVQCAEVFINRDSILYDTIEKFVQSAEASQGQSGQGQTSQQVPWQRQQPQSGSRLEPQIGTAQYQERQQLRDLMGNPMPDQSEFQGQNVQGDPFQRIREGIQGTRYPMKDQDYEHLMVFCPLNENADVLVSTLKPSFVIQSPKASRAQGSGDNQL
jgi:hypothetical protein